MFRSGYKIAIRTGLKALHYMALRNMEGPISLGRRTSGQFCQLFGVSTFETVWGFRLEEGFGLIAVT